MARKTASRLEKRREIEAAEAVEAAEESTGTKKATKKKAAKRTSRAKEKAPERRRLLWGVFNGSMKEEARFPYEQRAQAEEKMEALAAKGKKKYFIQPIKEVITDPLPGDGDDGDAAAKKKATKKKTVKRKAAKKKS